MWIEQSEFEINLFPIQMGKCPVIRGDGVMLVDTAHSDPSVADYSDTSPFEWGGSDSTSPGKTLGAG